MRPSLAVVLALLLTSTAPARAQDAPAKPPVQEQPVDPNDPEAVARAQIQGALDASITLDATDMPLEDVFALLREGPRLNLVVDPAAATADRTVTLQLQGTARQVLDRVLGDAGLQMRVWSGALLVTAPGKDLGTPPLPGADPAGRAIAGRRVTVDFDGVSMAEALSFLQEQAEVELEVAPDAERLVDAAEVHARLRDVTLPHALTLLTHLHGLTWRTNGKVRLEVRRPRERAPVGGGGPLSKEEVATRLETRVTLTMDEGNVFDLAAQLEARTGLRFRVDNASKEDTVSLELADTSVREALEIVCTMHGARWLVEEGGVVVLQLLARCDECGEPRVNGVSPCPECGAR